MFSNYNDKRLYSRSTAKSPKLFPRPPLSSHHENRWCSDAPVRCAPSYAKCQTVASCNPAQSCTNHKSPSHQTSDHHSVGLVLFSSARWCALLYRWVQRGARCLQSCTVLSYPSLPIVVHLSCVIIQLPVMFLDSGGEGGGVAKRAESDVREEGKSKEEEEGGGGAKKR